RANRARRGIVPDSPLGRYGLALEIHRFAIDSGPWLALEAVMTNDSSGLTRGGPTPAWLDISSARAPGGRIRAAREERSARDPGCHPLARCSVLRSRQYSARVKPPTMARRPNPDSSDYYICG